MFRMIVVFFEDIKSSLLGSLFNNETSKTLSGIHFRPETMNF